MTRGSVVFAIVGTIMAAAGIGFTVSTGSMIAAVQAEADAARVEAHYYQQQALALESRYQTAQDDLAAAKADMAEGWDQIDRAWARIDRQWVRIDRAWEGVHA